MIALATKSKHVHNHPLQPLPVESWNPKPNNISADIKNWSNWYLTDEEDMGESCEQTLIIRVLYSCLYEWLKEQNRNNVFIGTDQFFAWVPDQPLIRVSPDVYLLNDPPQILPDSWQTWLPGHNPPCLAFEIVSKGNWRKDYQDIQQKYAQLGVEELVIFDPIIAANRNLKTKKRSALQLFRRTTDGSFRKIYAGNNSIYCQELGAWLVIVEKFLRISRNQAGTNLVPTVEESEERERVAKELALKAKEKERNAKEKERKAKEKERKAKEQEQLARQNAERLLVEAQAEITRLKRLLGQNNT